MVQCNYCADWFHYDCVGLSQDEAEKMPMYKCDVCTDNGRNVMIIPGIAIYKQHRIYIMHVVGTKLPTALVSTLSQTGNTKVPTCIIIVSALQWVV